MRISLHFNYRQRLNTTQICVVLYNFANQTAADLYRKAYQLGELGTGYHYILYKTGEAVADRDIMAVASKRLPEGENSIYILADTTEGKLSDAQNYWLKKFNADRDLPLKIIKNRGFI